MTLLVLSTGLNRRMSSAYRMRLVFLERGSLEMEFITILKSKEPKIEPWGTPDVTLTSLDVVPSSTTVKYHSLLPS